MSRWHLHCLNARNALTLLLPAIRAAGNQAMGLTDAVMPVSPFDLVVRAAGPGAAVRMTPISAGVIEAVIDPALWDEAVFLRLLLRNIHQMMRGDDPGPAQTLGETLVAMGLAGHFVVQVLGSKPEPDEALAPAHGLAGRALREWAREDFDAGLWFKGQGDLPEGAGQGLAFALVSLHLSRHPDASAASLVHEPAESLRMSLRAMAVEDGQKPGRRITERSH